MWRHFLAKNRLNRKKHKTYHCLEYKLKVYYPANFGFKRIKTVKVVPWLDLSDSWPGVKDDKNHS